jgi:nitroreductase
MELAQLIRDRRSVQVYDDRPVPTELIAELLDTAVWAPNHHMTQPWRFILLQGDGRRLAAEARKQYAEAEGGADPERRRQRGEKAWTTTMAVPAILVIVMADDPQPVVRDEDLVATACVMQNFLLLAADRGLAVGVKTYGAAYHQAFRRGLAIGPGERAVAELQIGYATRLPAPQPRVPARDRLRVVDAFTASEA